MRSVTEEFKRAVASDNRRYLEWVDIKLKTGKTLNLTNKDIWERGIKYEDMVSSSEGFQIGSAVINKAVVSINNIYDKFSDIVFDDAEIEIYLGLQLSRGIEKVKVFTGNIVEAPVENSTIINLTCYDKMYKFDKDYSTSTLQYPATRRQIIEDACRSCGVALQTLTFDGDNIVVDTRPNDEKLTYRQVISWVAQIGCQWVKCDSNGKLIVGWYDLSKYETSSNENDFVQIKNNFSTSVYNDDVVITGVNVTEHLEGGEDGEKPATYKFGNDGYVLSISGNKLITKGKGESITKLIGQKIVGFRFRPFKVSCLSNIVIEAGDICHVYDSKGRKYKSVVTSTAFQVGDSQSILCEAKSAARNSSKQYSQLTQDIVDNRHEIQKEKTNREKALKELADKLAGAQGLYTTVEPAENGGHIFYLHNAPELKDSNIVWKMTADAWAVSTDGGKSWNAGLTVDGDMISRILNAIGVNAEWVRTGELTVTDGKGKETFYVNCDTGIVRINATSFSIKGETVDEYIKKNKLYTWIAYADDALGNGITTNPTGKEYIGFAENQTSELVDLSDPSIFKWSAIQGHPGTAGENGIATVVLHLYKRQSFRPNRPNNTLTYRFADDALIGSIDNGWQRTIPDGSSPIYVVSATASSRYDEVTLYGNMWSEPVILAQNGQNGLDGLPGKDGIPGADGADGKTSYFHVKYSPNANGNPMTETVDKYIGTYVDFNAYDSNNYRDYQWVQIEGQDGANGIPGKNGEDGRTSYLHIAYANSEDGSVGFSTTDSNYKLYIGQYTDFNLRDSTNYLDYNWTKIKGDNGLNVATVHLYQRSKNGAPIKPNSDITYRFRDGFVSGLSNGWLAVIPSGKDPIYTILATASSTKEEDIIPRTEWTEPEILVENGENGKMFYAECTTSGSAKEKVVTVENFGELEKGKAISIQFLHKNIADYPTLKVNDTEATVILVYGEALTSSSQYNWGNNATIVFVFDGTNWTIADGGVLEKVEEASKVATNYMEFEAGTGLQVGNKSSGNWVGCRTQMIGDSFNILDQNGNALASYGLRMISLGKNSKSSIIDLCGGSGKISYGEITPTSGKGYENAFNFSSDGLMEISSWEGIIVRNYRYTLPDGRDCETWVSFRNGIEIVCELEDVSGPEHTAIRLFGKRIELDGIVKLLEANALDVKNSISMSDGAYVKIGSDTVFGLDGNRSNLLIGYGSKETKNTYVYGKEVILGSRNMMIFLENTSSSNYDAFLRPSKAGRCTLGTSAYPWYRVYATNTTISTSDGRMKENIVPLGQQVQTYSTGFAQTRDIHSELFDKLKPVQFNFIKGNDKTCFGLVAQDVIQSMGELGIGENELDLVHHDFYTDENGETQDTYGIAYENLIAMLIHEVQVLKKEVAELKGAKANEKSS